MESRIAKRTARIFYCWNATEIVSCSKRSGEKPFLRAKRQNWCSIRKNFSEKGIRWMVKNHAKGSSRFGKNSQTKGVCRAWGISLKSTARRRQHVVDAVRKYPAEYFGLNSLWEPATKLIRSWRSSGRLPLSASEHMSPPTSIIHFLNGSKE